MTPLPSLYQIKEQAGRNAFKHILINNKYQKTKVGKTNILTMKKTFTLRHMFVSIFTILSMVTNAESINYISDDGFMYGLDTETHNAELKEYSGSATEIVVPESVEYNGGEYKVTRLGDNCFSFHYLTSIDIPSSVTSIGEKCFYWCYYLTKVNIPASVTSIEDGCFMYCANLGIVV